MREVFRIVASHVRLLTMLRDGEHVRSSSNSSTLASRSAPLQRWTRIRPTTTNKRGIFQKHGFLRRGSY